MWNLKLLKSIYSNFIPLLTGLILLFSSQAFAQTGAGSAPNVRTYVDSNSVDLLTGERIFSFHLVSIGLGGDGLSANVVTTRRGNYNIDRHSYWGAINEYSGTYIVSIGEGAEDFTLNNSTFISKSQTGSTLTLVGNTYTYTTADGTVALYDGGMKSTSPMQANKAILTSVTAPNGQKLYMDYDYQPLGVNKAYLRSVRNNLGYQLKFTDEEENVTAINNRDEYCSPTLETCGPIGITTSKWAMSEFDRLPSTVVSSGTYMSMDYAESSFSEFRVGGRDIITATDEDLGYTFDPQNGRVTSVDVNGALWNYSYSDNGGERTTSITAPLGGTRVVVSNISDKVVLSDTDALGRNATYTYDTYNRLLSSTAPSGVRTEYDYDSRGNVTETRVIATNSATLTTKAGYPATCSNRKTCNKPLWAEDTKGARTDYTYNSTHGGVVSVTGPAPAVGQPRPKLRYYYTEFAAKIKNSTGTLVDAPDKVWKLRIVRACPNATTCTYAPQERYVIQNYNTSQNLFPNQKQVLSGDQSINVVTTAGTDLYGNVTYVDGPLSGTADRTYFFYDAKEQRRIGVIGPDPDNTGSLPRQAVKYDYAATGQMMATKTGFTPGTTLNALNTMTVKQTSEYIYDTYGRPERISVKDGGTVMAVQQVEYDAKGRVLCRTSRMDKNDLIGMPNACALDNPSDRITRLIYNTTNQVTAQFSAYLTPDQTLVNNTYNANGNLRLIRDQEGRYTYYYYDTFNRHYKTYYPKKDGTPGLSGDYTQKYFDQYGRQDAARLRDGTIVDFLRDDLDRIYHVDAPNTANDYSYSFDLFGRVTMSTKGGVTSVANSYDALSRLKTEANDFGTTSYDYDVAGRMTKLTYPGTGLFVNYDYNYAGQVTKIRENGATSGAGVLAHYIYDDQGRRDAMIRGNGHITSYDYDNLSRLTDMTQDAAGTANDLTLSFEYNPAGQITRQERSSTAYDWDINNLEANSFINNGLNQAISMYNGTTTTAITYDARGNLTAHSGKTYDYDIFNSLTSVSGTSAQTGTVLNVTLEYDAKGRLNKEIDSGTETRFAYSGSQLIAEYNQYNTPTARYVHGPGSDEPIVMFNDPMNISGQQETLWMMSDTRGSIIGYTNASGAVTNINTYSPEGVPGDNNVGRFGYTGQMWLEGAELYHYKARAYDPQLGRFLQADPIGYGDGLNMYAYVGGDAINSRDPSGMKVCDEGDPECEDEVVGTGTSVSWRTIIFRNPLEGLNLGGGINIGGFAGQGGIDAPEEVEEEENCSTFRKIANLYASIPDAAIWQGEVGFGLVLVAKGGLGPVKGEVSLDIISIRYRQGTEANGWVWSQGASAKGNIGTLTGSIGGTRTTSLRGWQNPGPFTKPTPQAFAGLSLGISALVIAQGEYGLDLDEIIKAYGCEAK